MLHHTTRTLVALGLTLTTALALGVLAGPAAGDTAPTNPSDPKTPVTVSADALPTAQINGVVWRQAIVGNTVYAGGSFSQARPAGAAAGTNQTPRSNLLAFDLATGVLNTTFKPTVNAQVLTVLASPDGKRVYIGGDFTSVNGTAVYRIAAFDTATGALVSTFKPRFNAQVSSIALSADGSVLYAGGKFSSVNSVARARLASVNTADGSLRPWAPTADKKVSDLVVSPDGGIVVVGGQFTALNGSSSPGYGLGAVSSTTGALVTPFQVNNVVRNAGDNSGIGALATDGTYLYGTGWKFGAGGNFEGAFQARWSDRTINWLEDCHGDTYDVYPGATAVYTVGHAHYCKNIGGFPETSPRSWHRALGFSRARTGTVARDYTGYFNFQGQPSPSLLHWYPDLNTGTYTGQSQGPWTVTGDTNYVVMGGEFRTVNGTAQQGLVRFATRALATNKQGPRLYGDSIKPTLSVLGSNVTVRWPSNWDRDNTNLTYSVIRDGNATPSYTTATATTFWVLPTMQFVDQNVPAGTHTYRIKVTDPLGNSQTSTTVSVSVGAALNGQLQLAPDGPTHGPISTPPATPEAPVQGTEERPPRTDQDDTVPPPEAPAVPPGQRR